MCRRITSPAPTRSTTGSRTNSARNPGPPARHPITPGPAGPPSPSLFNSDGGSADEYAETTVDAGYGAHGALPLLAAWLGRPVAPRVASGARPGRGADSGIEIPWAAPVRPRLRAGHALPGPRQGQGGGAARLEKAGIHCSIDARQRRSGCRNRRSSAACARRRAIMCSTRTGITSSCSSIRAGRCGGRTAATGRRRPGVAQLDGRVGRKEDHHASPTLLETAARRGGRVRRRSRRRRHHQRRAGARDGAPRAGRPHCRHHRSWASGSTCCRSHSRTGASATPA